MPPIKKILLILSAAVAGGGGFALVSDFINPEKPTKQEIELPTNLPPGSAIAQEVCHDNPCEHLPEPGWWVRFSTGEEVAITSSSLVKILEGKAIADKDSFVKGFLSAKFTGEGINWSEFKFDIDEAGNITNVCIGQCE